MSDFSATSAAANRERLLASVVDACLRDLQEQQEPPSIDKYIAQYPELAEELQALLPALCALGEFDKASDEEDDPPEFPSLSDPVAPQARLGDYVIHRELGRGGMGVVYEALQVSLNRAVALKVLPFASVLEPTDIQRFKNEAQIAAQVHHPHIVPVYAVGCENGVHYYAMQMIEGQTVAQLIRRLAKPETLGVLPEPSTVTVAPRSPSSRPAVRKPPSGKSETVAEQQGISTAATSLSRSDKESFRTIARWGIQAAEALHYAHSLGLVHRDIKPSNLLLDHQSKLWVSDFGLAKVASGPHLTLTGDLIGTIAYMSPEQTGKTGSVVDHRSDIYSLGATLYELVGLKRVFTSQNRMELLQQVANSEPKPLRQVNRHVPVDLETIIHKALTKEPNDRYATAQEMSQDLARFLEARPIHARRPSLADRAGKWVQRHRVLVASLAAVLLLTTFGSLVSAGLILNAKNQTEVALTEAQSQKAAAEEAFKGQQTALAEAKKQEAAALAALARERAALEEVQSQSEVARQAVDDMYYELVRDWLWDTPHRTRVQEDFMRKALAYYEGLPESQLEQDSVAFGYASVLGQIGVIHYGLDENSQAHDFYVQAIELLEDLHTGDSAQWDYRNRLAHAYVADAQALYKMGRISEMSQRLEQASATIEEMLALDPDNSKLEVLRLRLDAQFGVYWFAAGNPQQAEQHWSKALQREPPLMQGDTELHRAELLVKISCMLADLLCFQDKPQAALEHLIQAREHLAIAQRQGRALWPVLKLQRDLAVSENRVYAMSQQYDQAIRATLEANEISLALLRDFPEVRAYASYVIQDHIVMARLLLLYGAYDEAETYVASALALSDQLIEHYPQHQEYRRDQSKLFLCLAQTYAQRRDWENASHYNKQALRLSLHLMEVSPSNLSFQTLHLETLEENARFTALVPEEILRDVRLSLSAAARVIDLDPGSRSGYRMLAIGLYRQGRYNDVIQQLEHTDPTQGLGRTVSYLLLALSHYQLGDQEQALASYKAAQLSVNQPGEYRDILTQLLFEETEDTLDLPHQPELQPIALPVDISSIYPEKPLENYEVIRGGPEEGEWSDLEFTLPNDQPTAEPPLGRDSIPQK